MNTTDGPKPTTIDDVRAIVASELAYWSFHGEMAAVRACDNIIGTLYGKYAPWHPQPTATNDYPRELEKVTEPGPVERICMNCGTQWTGGAGTPIICPHCKSEDIGVVQGRYHGFPLIADGLKLLDHNAGVYKDQ